MQLFSERQHFVFDFIHQFRLLLEDRLNLGKYTLISLYDGFIGWLFHLLKKLFEVGTVGVQKQLKLFTHKQVVDFSDAVQEVSQILYPFAYHFEVTVARNVL